MAGRYHEPLPTKRPTFVKMVSLTTTMQMARVAPAAAKFSAKARVARVAPALRKYAPHPYRG